MEASSRSPGLLALVEEIRRTVVDQDHTCRSSSSSSSPQSRFQLLKLIDQLRLAVETPTDTVLRLIYQPAQNAALRTVMDLGIFELLADQEKRGLSASELSASTNAERGLIVRLMRVMEALGLCTSPECEVYRPTPKTAILTQPIGRDGIRCIYDLTMPTLARLPEYFREHHYTAPREYSRSPMRWAVGQSQFEWLAQHRHQQVLFNSYMSSRRQGKPSWFEVYPIDRLLQGASTAGSGSGAAAAAATGSVFVVDVGGNQGHDLIRLRERHPRLPGRLVLQDLPSVVAGVVAREGIETMAYSFLDPQPIGGARAYYFRAIFHDWPDHICQKILLNTVSAMDATNSRILIVDFVLPDTDAPLLQASLDIQMMSIGSGVERSKRQWTELLESAGLEIRGIWSGSSGLESVIEAVKRPILRT